MSNNKQYTIGIDIGGTNLKAVLFDGEKVIADYSLATPKDTLDHFLIMLKALIEPLEKEAKKLKVKIKRIGLGIPGLIDFKEKKIIKTPSLPLLNGVNLAEIIEKNIKLPVAMDNDGNCFLLAEIKLGVGIKYKNIYGLTLGTSIGSAWYNKKIYYGSHEGANEIAHTVISCPEPIELEELYQKLSQNNPAKLAEEAYRGDDLAKKTYAEIGTHLGIAIANMVNIIDPEVIIIGGGVIDSGELFLTQVKKTMKKHIFHPESKKIKILKSKLGEYAGAIGAALLNEQQA